MDQTNPCPMCGATIRTDAKRCLRCGELFAPTAPRRAILLAEVNMAAILPGALAAVAAYLAYVLSAYIGSPGYVIADLEPAVGVLLALVVGALLGSAVAAAVRKIRRPHSSFDSP